MGTMKEQIIAEFLALAAAGTTTDVFDARSGERVGEVLDVAGRRAAGALEFAVLR